MSTGGNTPLGGGAYENPGFGGGAGAGASGVELAGLLNALLQITRGLSGIQMALGNSFVSLAANNVFTGDNSFDGTSDFTGAVTFGNAATFAVPPLVNAGAVGTGKFAPEGKLSTQLSIAGVGNGADTTDDVLFSVSLPAHSFDTVGRGVSIMAFGATAGNTHDKRIRVLFGSSVVFSTGTITSNGLGWQLTLTVYKSGASTQLATATGNVGTAVVAVPVPIAGSETDTGAITISVTGASQTTGAASDVVGNGLVVTFMD